MENIRFEGWLWYQTSAEIKYLHNDNGLFDAGTFSKYFQEKGQLQSFLALVQNIKIFKKSAIFKK